MTVNSELSCPPSKQNASQILHDMQINYALSLLIDPSSLAFFSLSNYQK